MNFLKFKQSIIAVIAAASISLSYSPSAESQYLKKKNDGTLVVGFDNIVNMELGRELGQKLGPEIFYLEDRCYLPAAGIEKMLEDGPAKVYAALDMLEKEGLETKSYLLPGVSKNIPSYDIKKHQESPLGKLIELQNRLAIVKEMNLYGPWTKLPGVESRVGAELLGGSKKTIAESIFLESIENPYFEKIGDIRIKAEEIRKIKEVVKKIEKIKINSRRAEKK